MQKFPIISPNCVIHFYVWNTGVPERHATRVLRLLKKLYPVEFKKFPNFQ
jgi:hypothetical protein